MQIGSFRFTPPWWGIALTVLAVAALSALGVWQIERAHYKERLVAAHVAAKRAGPQPLNLTPGEVNAGHGPRYGYRYIAHGHYDTAHQILLADQVEGTRTGYRVWTPLVLDSGVRVMVDRGWKPRVGERDTHQPSPDAPRGRITVHGYWRVFPQPGLQFGTSHRCNLSGWPRPLNYPDVATVRCQYEKPVADGLLLLAPKQAGGFVRDWDEDPIGLRPWAHYVYASQWFLMAVIAVIILGVVNTRRAS